MLLTDTEADELPRHAPAASRASRTRGARSRCRAGSARRRDHGGLIFVDLRDRSGAVQLVIDPERSPDAHAVAHRLRLEEVIRVRGELVPRSRGHPQPGARDRRCRALGRRGRAARPVRAAALPARRGERRRDAAHPPSLPRPAPPRDAAHPEDPSRRHADHAPLPRGARLLGARDADADALDARRRARLPRAGTAASRQLLRTAAEPAALQAAPDVSPATTATTRSPAASATRPSAPTASSSSPSSTSR